MFRFEESYTLSSVPLTTAEFRGSCGAQTTSLTLAWSGVPDDLTCFPLCLDLACRCCIVVLMQGSVPTGQAPRELHADCTVLKKCETPIVLAV